jgi:cell division protease FtsH
MDDTKLIDRISERQAKLADAAKSLKEHFVGLDDVIDKIAQSIEAWYCMPELLTRPTIVCLWGLTGIGKTDLVRRLVKLLSFEDSFVEIQMTNKGSSSNTYANTLQGLLSNSNVCPEEPGILLLDEIQRFRSVDDEGKEIHDYHFQDLWMLLSDGSFGSASDNKQQLIELLMEAVYWEDYHAAQKAAAEKKKKAAAAAGDDDDDDDDDDEEEKKEVESKRKFKQTYWHAKQLKRKLRLTETVEEIMKWDASRKVDMLTEKLNDKSIYKPEVYGKLLVFVSGNLDEAYSMADEASETDVDADIFHKHSTRINLLSIKEALTERFKPEQIARFGNTHVIYPALSRASYEEIIRRKIQEVLDNVEKACGVVFHCRDTVYDAIYRNGVFPVQGTRPVFSTIASFFECMLPTFTLKALRSKVKDIELFYEKKHLCATIGKEVLKLKNEGEIDRIKKEKRNLHQIRKVALHETGHAMTYAMLFGYVPTQVAVVVASEDKNGFVGLHAIDSAYTLLLNQIKVFLAGRIAEEIVFGKEQVNGGASGDLDRATSLAANLIRIYGMGERLSRMDLPTGHYAINHNLDIKATNDQIEEVLQAQRVEAEKLIRSKMGLLRDMTNYLIKYEKISDNKFIALCAEHGVECETLDAKEIVFLKYKDMYDSFWGKETELK